MAASLNKGTTTDSSISDEGEVSTKSRSPLAARIKTEFAASLKGGELVGGMTGTLMPIAGAGARPFILCADDYALTEAVSRGILDLAADGRISATSAMSNRPSWRHLAKELSGLQGRLGVGLHLNLTVGQPLGPMPDLAPGGELPRLGHLMSLAFRGELVRREVEAEVGRQLDAFSEALGRAPDFIDGHEHVHILPKIRAALFASLVARNLTEVWVRDPADSLKAIVRRGVAPLKSIVIASLAAGFAGAARARGFATNEGFSGARSFDPARDFGADFARFLIAPGERHLVMCHPGRAGDELAADPIAACRQTELSFLSSQRFLDACAAAGLRVSPVWD